ncbi:CRISPR-associated endonuclease Cas3'', partial [Thermus brockianus]
METGKTLRAHTPNGEGRWHFLKDHLEAVAQRASEFAQAFGTPKLNRALGYLHDAGKATEEFQDYLQRVARGGRLQKVPHSIWGAALAYALLSFTHKEKGKFAQSGWEALALPVLGHHAGLPSRGEATSKLGKTGERARQEGVFQSILDFLEEEGLKEATLQALKEALEEVKTKVAGHEATSLRLDLLIRMAFSALVDADYLDTEAHFDPHLASLRQGQPTLESLWQRLQRAQEALLQTAPKSPVNRVRSEVYEACLKAAELPPGLFRLTVPTGGGKTRSGLAFALKHALMKCCPKFGPPQERGQGV